MCPVVAPTSNGRTPTVLPMALRPEVIEFASRMREESLRFIMEYRFAVAGMMSKVTILQDESLHLHHQHQTAGQEPSLTGHYRRANCGASHCPSYRGAKDCTERATSSLIPNCSGDERRGSDLRHACTSAL